MIEVADLVAKLGLDDMAYNRGMDAAELRAKSGALLIGGAFAGMGVAAAAGLVASVKAASGFQTMMSNVQGNTTLTNAQMQIMSVGIQKLAVQTGSPLAALAEGFRHASNMGFNAADSLKLVTAANKSALSTGGDTAAVTNVLATQMHEFGLKAAQAAMAMNVLHLASAESNTTLDQYVNSTSKAVAMAANLGVSFTDANAALSALGRHMNISQASTAFAGEMVKMVASSVGAHKMLVSLSRTTGIDLVGDFTSAGLASRGFVKVQEDLAKATKGNASEMLKLIAATRGGLSALILSGTGAKDFHDILKDLTATMAGKTDPTSEAFARQQATLASQTDKVREGLHVLGITLGTVLLPPLTQLTQTLVPLISQVTDWARVHAKLADAILGSVAALGGLAGARILLAPLGAALGAISLPLVAIGAASAGLALAWQRDWGGIRERVREVQDEFRLLVNLFKLGGVGLTWDVIKYQVESVVGNLGTWIRSVGAPALVTHLQMWGDAFVSWVKPKIPLVLHELGVLASQLWSWIRTVGAPALVTHLQTWGDAFVSWVGPKIPPLVTELGKLASRLWGWITGTALPTIKTRLGEWGTAFWHWVQPATTALVSHLPALRDQLGTWITGAVQFLGPKLAGWVSAFWQWVRPATANLMSHMPALLTSLGNWITHAVETLGPKLAEWGGAFWQWIRHAGPPMTRELTKLALLLTAGAVQIGASLALAFNTWFDATGSSELQAFGADMGNAVLSGMWDAMKKIGPALGGAFDKATDSAAKSVVKTITPDWYFNWVTGKDPAGALLGGLTSTASGLFGQPGAQAPGPPAGARGGAGVGGPVHITVNVAPTGVTAQGGSADHRATGVHIGRAVDEALRQLAGAGGGGQGGHRLLPGQS